jgi:hypothetical protein
VFGVRIYLGCEIFLRVSGFFMVVWSMRIAGVTWIISVIRVFKFIRFVYVVKVIRLIITLDEYSKEREAPSEFE